jgi:hypothetical protein
VVNLNHLEHPVSLILIAADLVSILALVFLLFVPRHQCRDLIVAYLVVNVGVLALMATLSAVATSLGVGLGLFGVLSIIRLRSEELAQHEVAYYFAALALGLLAGNTALAVEWTLGLMAAVLVTLFVGDHPRVARRTSRQQVTLDHACADDADLRPQVEAVIGGRVQELKVVRTDLVNDTTVVDVRYLPSPMPVRERVDA